MQIVNLPLMDNPTCALPTELPKVPSLWFGSNREERTLVHFPYGLVVIERTLVHFPYGLVVIERTLVHFPGDFIF